VAQPMQKSRYIEDAARAVCDLLIDGLRAQPSS
jgi:hypothetical protein